MSLSKLGTWPVDGEEARTKGDLYKVGHSDRLTLIAGQDHPVLWDFCVSNDYMHMGELIIPVGGVGPRASEPMSHKGDAVFYVIDGPATFYVKATDETFHVRDKEAFFLPSDVDYQCINYGSQPIKLVFAIAPGL